MTTKHLVAALVGAILVLPCGAAAQTDAQWLERCDDWGDGDRELFCEIRNVEVASSGTLDIESDNGVVQIAGADQQDVRLRARVRAWADSRSQAQALARDVRIVVDGGQVHATGPDSDRGEGWQVDFVGTVPRAYGVQIDAQNGPVSVRDVAGDVWVEGSNGPLDLRGLSGAVRARTSNGPLTLEMTGVRLAAGGIDVQTSNGPLTITLARGVDARLSARTGNGPISTNLDVPIQRHGRRGPSGEIEATLGDGGPEIRARTSNGPLTITAD